MRSIKLGLLLLSFLLLSPNPALATDRHHHRRPYSQVILRPSYGHYINHQSRNHGWHGVRHHGGHGFRGHGSGHGIRGHGSGHHN